jgi:Glycosyl transferases group 1
MEMMAVRPAGSDEEADRYTFGGAAVRVAGAAYRRTRKLLPSSGRPLLDGAFTALTGASSLRYLDLSRGRRRRRSAPDRLFVGWLLHADEDGGAARVQALFPHAYLRRVGVNSIILRKPRVHYAPLRFGADEVARLVAARLDVVVFQGVHGASAVALARALRAAGTRTVFVTGDLFGHDIAQAVDHVVGASEGLTAVAGPHQKNTSVIESALDAPPGLVKDHARPAHGERVRVVWVGYPENLPLLAPVREALTDRRLAGYELVTISRGPGVTYQWHRRHVHRQLIECDIGVLPVGESDWYRAKPNTRMTMLKALGLPMVASPIEAYQRTLTPGLGCYFARTPPEWADALAALAKPDARRVMGLAEREIVLARYGHDAVGAKWHALFRSLAPGRH